MFIFKCVHLQVLTDVATTRNAQQLPPARPLAGLRLPADRFCLTAPNYRLRSAASRASAAARDSTGAAHAASSATAARRATPGRPIGGKAGAQSSILVRAPAPDKSDQ